MDQGQCDCACKAGVAAPHGARRQGVHSYRPTIMLASANISGDDNADKSNCSPEALDASKKRLESASHGDVCVDRSSLASDAVDATKGRAPSESSRGSDAPAHMPLVGEFASSAERLLPSAQR